MDYLDKIKSVIADCKEKYQNLEDKRLLWDVMKCEIRADTISYACHKAKVQRRMELELSERLTYLEEQISEDPSMENQEEYSLVKSEVGRIKQKVRYCAPEPSGRRKENNWKSARSASQVVVSTPQ
jgi:hypothetical protein